MTKKAYITRGFANFSVALVAAKMFWRMPPDSQDGFRTVVELS